MQKLIKFFSIAINSFIITTEKVMLQIVFISFAQKLCCLGTSVWLAALMKSSCIYDYCTFSFDLFILKLSVHQLSLSKTSKPFVFHDRIPSEPSWDSVTPTSAFNVNVTIVIGARRIWVTHLSYVLLMPSFNAQSNEEIIYTSILIIS